VKEHIDRIPKRTKISTRRKKKLRKILKMMEYLFCNTCNRSIRPNTGKKDGGGGGDDSLTA
jgi:hypothetical protein